MNTAIVVDYMFPAAVPLVDFSIAKAWGKPEEIISWNTAKLGAQPTLTQLEAAWPAAQLQSMQAAQNALNHASYQLAIQGPVSFTSAGGITAMYQADPQSIANLQSVILGFQLKQATPSGFYWRAANNTNTPFTYADLLGLAQAMAEPAAAAWAKMQSLKAQVAAATTVTAVSDIVW
jgi:hypothetical protein